MPQMVSVLHPFNEKRFCSLMEGLKRGIYQDVGSPSARFISSSANRKKFTSSFVALVRLRVKIHLIDPASASGSSGRRLKDAANCSEIVRHSALIAVVASRQFAARLVGSCSLFRSDPPAGRKRMRNILFHSIPPVCWALPFSFSKLTVFSGQAAHLLRFHFHFTPSAIFGTNGAMVLVRVVSRCHGFESPP